MSSIFKYIQQSIGNWHQRRTTIHALSALNDHMLKDIGIARSEIQSFAAELTHQAEPSRIRAVHPAGPAHQSERASAKAAAQDDEWPKAA